MRPFVISLLVVGLATQTSLLHAQRPFGPAGFGPRVGIRPLMPPAPPFSVPGVQRPVPGYVRVPGIALVPPGFVAPIGPAIGPRSAAIVALPLTPVVVGPGYSAARVALVQPAPRSAGVYQAGSAGYRAAPAGSRSASSGAVNDLRPGMVLADGSVVVSFGQPGSPAAAANSTEVAKPAVPTPTIQPASPTPASPTPASPTPAPVTDPVSNEPAATQSILEPEELPSPAASDKPLENSSTKQF